MDHHHMWDLSHAICCEPAKIRADADEPRRCRSCPLRSAHYDRPAARGGRGHGPRPGRRERESGPGRDPGRGHLTVAIKMF